MTKSAISSEVIREAQVLYLNRQWSILDGIREYRTKAMLATGTLDLSITGFTLNSSSIPADSMQRVLIAAALALITLLGLGLFYAVRAQYMHHLKKIWHLYESLGMQGESFHGSEAKAHDQAWPLFIIGYLAISAIGLLCICAVVMSPLKL